MVRKNTYDIIDQAKVGFYQELIGHYTYFAEQVDLANFNWEELSRKVHLVRGGAGFFGFPQLEEEAKQAQTVLQDDKKDDTQKLEALKRLIDLLETITARCDS